MIANESDAAAVDQRRGRGEGKDHHSNYADNVVDAIRISLEIDVLLYPSGCNMATIRFNQSILPPQIECHF